MTIMVGAEWNYFRKSHRRSLHALKKTLNVEACDDKTIKNETLTLCLSFIELRECEHVCANEHT